ncbi:MAG: hypothetical protein ACT4N8_02210 [Sphingosinicella sp.]
MALERQKPTFGFRPRAVAEQEAGKKKPGGTALRLSRVVQKHGLRVLAKG